MAKDTYDRDSRLKLDREDLDQAKYLKSVLDRIAVRVGNEYGAPLFTHKKESDININDLFGLANGSGILDGEVYDEIEYGLLTNGCSALTYSFEEIHQFQVIINLVNKDSFRIFKRPAEFVMLTEVGDTMVTESGNILKIQGLTP